MSKKEFKTLNIRSNSIDITGQKIAVFELVQVQFIDTGKRKVYTYGTEGDQYIIDWNSQLAQRMISKAQNEELVSLNTAEFRTLKENDSGEIWTRHYHQNVVHPLID